LSLYRKGQAHNTVEDYSDDPYDDPLFPRHIYLPLPFVTAFLRADPPCLSYVILSH
jgi:hypothetical protein